MPSVKRTRPDLEVRLQVSGILSPQVVSHRESGHRALVHHLQEQELQFGERLMREVLRITGRDQPLLPNRCGSAGGVHSGKLHLDNMKWSPAQHSPAQHAQRSPPQRRRTCTRAGSPCFSSTRM